ncbi:MAG: hypothetical protein R3B45_06190 [Bdellovibrionota bacterium]
MKKLNRKYLIILALGTVIHASIAVAAGRFSQLILPFESERDVEFQANKNENSITILLRKTSPDELKALDLYDEAVIKRILIKDHGPAGCEIKLILRDKNIRASIEKRQEPFRVIIDLFDKNYKIDTDPTTGLPLVSDTSENNTYKQQADLTEQTHPLVYNNNLVEQPKLQQDPSADSTSSILPSDTQEKQTNHHRLLQPMPDEVDTPDALIQLIETAEPGRSKHWKQYPPYIYPLQTASYEGRKEPSGWIKKNSSKALTSSQAMAEYAYKFFSFGHESRALLAYQQVLRKNPSIFSKDALHLWAFAETHFGHGNLTLALGYYDMLIKNHPESSLAKFAYLRKLDYKSLQIIENGRTKELHNLQVNLEKIIPGNNSELRAQIAIRKAYWNLSPENFEISKTSIPVINNSTKEDLLAAYQKVEGQRTAFLANSLLLNYMIQSKNPWQDSYGSFADQYFRQFRGPGSEPYLSDLKKKLRLHLAKQLDKNIDEKNYLASIQLFENLPKPLQSIKKDADVAWQLAESYRNQSLNEKALPLYQFTSQKVENNSKRFQAAFWSATIAENKLQAKRNKNININKLKKQINDSDRMMISVWNSLSEEEKNKLSTANKEHLESVIMSNSHLKAPLDIVLNSWSKKLSSQLTVNNEETQPSTETKDSPTASSIYLLEKLANKFQEHGEVEKRKKTIRIMQSITPKSFQDDKKAQQIWSKELLSLAEEYRKANNYLEAGRLYTFTAQNSQNNDNRAENLYKGGLLLYRSGQRKKQSKLSPPPVRMAIISSTQTFPRSV